MLGFFLPDFQVFVEPSTVFLIIVLHDRVKENTSPVTNYVPDKPAAFKLVSSLLIRHREFCACHYLVFHLIVFGIIFHHSLSFSNVTPLLNNTTDPEKNKR